MTPALREDARVTPLELFFDLVFVLGITQCTALMAETPTWEGIARGLLVLGVLWWTWVGYAWLTSVLHPDEGIVRISIFAAMAALLVGALAIPGVFDEDALLFATAYGVVRAAHIVLFAIGSRDDPRLRRSVAGLAGSTAVGVSLIFVATAFDGVTQGVVWAIALALDVSGPYLFGSEGWRLVPGHFAERHGLIVIIALGESIVAIGIGADGALGAGEVTAAGLGIVVAAALWWLYFDVVALVAERKLTEAPAGRQQNELARDLYSYLHFTLVAGVVLIALGMKKTLEHVGDELKTVPAVAMYAGAALYLLGHVAFRYRNVRTLNKQRLVVSVLLVAAIPLARELSALAALATLAGVLVALIGYETIRFADARQRIRNAES